MLKAALWITLGLTVIGTLFLALWLGRGDGQELDLKRLENLAQTSYVYDGEDQLLARLTVGENRDKVELSAISPYLIQAVIVTEDARFYQHPGVDPVRILGALWADLKAWAPVQGASTLTQQVVKLTHLSSEKTWSRKIREAVLALQLEQRYEKDELLTCYLNLVYFGNGAYGVQAAARSYFNKDAIELTCAEAALLAGVIQSPSAYAPHLNPEASLRRRNLVLGLMREGGLTEEEYRAALAETPKLSLSRVGDYAHGWYVDAALKEASQLLGLEYDAMIAGGYRIYTAMEPQAQSLAEELFAQSDAFPADAQDGTAVEGALVLLRSESGLAAALVGGRSYTRRGFDRAVMARRQPGSAIKPLLVFAPALQVKGYSPATPVLDAPFTGEAYNPSNASGDYKGWITLRQALSQSVNTPAVRLMRELGVETCKRYAANAGIQWDPEDDSLALALGGMTTGVSPWTLAGAYTALADEGLAHPPSAIRSICSADGKELYRHPNRSEKVFSRQTSYMMASVLSDAATEGSARALAEAGVPLAAKTGTVAYRGAVAGVRDLWTAAYNAEYTAVCWMGFDSTDDGHCLPRSSGGGQEPARLTARLFAGLYPAGGGPEFVRPEGLTLARLDASAITEGKLLLAGPYTPRALRLDDWFYEGRTPVAVSTRFSPPPVPRLLQADLRQGFPRLRVAAEDTLVIQRAVDQGEFTEYVRLQTQKGAVDWLDEAAQSGHSYRYRLYSLRSDGYGGTLQSAVTDPVTLTLPAEPARDPRGFWERFFGME